MEKIGICTFYNNNNYGSYLQTFALEAVIGSMGSVSYTHLTLPTKRIV